MDITTSYCIDLKHQFYPAGRNPAGEPRTGKIDARLMWETSSVCLETLKLCTQIFLAKWDTLSAYPVTPVKGGTCRRAQAEKLVHSTKANHAPYPEFDRLFPGMPSYTRRSIIADALGLVSSYVSNHRNWESLRPSERGAEPVISFPSRYGLTFYEQERDLDGLRDCRIRLKLFNGKTWEWHAFQVRKSDAAYIQKLMGARKLLSPAVEKVHGKYLPSGRKKSLPRKRRVHRSVTIV